MSNDLLMSMFIILVFTAGGMILGAGITVRSYKKTLERAIKDPKAPWNDPNEK